MRPCRRCRQAGVLPAPIPQARPGIRPDSADNRSKPATLQIGASLQKVMEATAIDSVGRLLRNSVLLQAWRAECGRATSDRGWATGAAVRRGGRRDGGGLRPAPGGRRLAGRLSHCPRTPWSPGKPSPLPPHIPTASASCSLRFAPVSRPKGWQGDAGKLALGAAIGILDQASMRLRVHVGASQARPLHLSLEFQTPPSVKMQGRKRSHP
jgi:hypothetical protein